MAQFVYGRLVENRPGAVYQDLIWDRWLLLRHASGKELRVFDFESTSSEIPEDVECELVVSPTVFRSLRLVDDVLTDDLQWSCEIIALAWMASEGGFDRFAASLYQNRGGEKITWALMETGLGQMIALEDELNQELNQNVKVGDIVTWQKARFDLYAILCPNV